MTTDKHKLSSLSGREKQLSVVTAQPLLSKWFFCVWCPTRSSPTRKHSTQEKATKEAVRLSLKYPDNQYFVLEAIDVFHSPSK